MAGFDQIKRKLEKYNKESDTYEVIFEDAEKVTVDYEKFYEDDEIIYYNYEQFKKLFDQLQINEAGVYRFSVDTLGAYLNTTCDYKAAYTFTIKPLSYTEVFFDEQ